MGSVMYKICLVSFLASCASLKVNFEDSTRTVAAAHFVDGNVPKDDVAVCRIKDGASEWSCMRWQSVLDATRPDGGTETF